MKYLVALAIGAIASIFALALPTPIPSGKLTLVWDYPGPITNPPDSVVGDIVFKIYHTTNASLPMTNWTVIATVPGTNRSYSLTVVPGPNFFAMTASNFWREADFSAAVSTPPLPSSAANLSLTRTN